MSMPGFVFHFRCVACGHNSDEYPLHVFSNTLEPVLMLPAWSRRLGCYMTISCDLTAEDRHRCQNDASELARIAKMIGNDHVTVGVPRWGQGLAEREVRVTPSPTCPKCGAAAEAAWGYPSEHSA